MADFLNEKQIIIVGLQQIYGIFGTFAMPEGTGNGGSLTRVIVTNVEFMQKGRCAT